MLESESSSEEHVAPRSEKRPRGDRLDVAAVAEQLSRQKGDDRVDGMLPVVHLLGILEQLDGFPMTLAVLRDSGIAKAVKPLRGHKDSRVASAAAELFARWK
eukprot:COSAG02_NODE_21754_length_776_cov_0.898080_1_plen_101_part_01